jgi:hypothetical protein
MLPAFARLKEAGMSLGASLGALGQTVNGAVGKAVEGDTKLGNSDGWAAFGSGMGFVLGLVIDFVAAFVHGIGFVVEFVNHLTGIVFEIKDSLGSVGEFIGDMIFDAVQWGSDLIHNFVKGMKQAWEDSIDWTVDLLDFLGGGFLEGEKEQERAFLAKHARRRMSEDQMASMSPELKANPFLVASMSMFPGLGGELAAVATSATQAPPQVIVQAPVNVTIGEATPENATALGRVVSDSMKDTASVLRRLRVGEF